MSVLEAWKRKRYRLSIRNNGTFLMKRHIIYHTTRNRKCTFLPERNGKLTDYQNFVMAFRLSERLFSGCFLYEAPLSYDRAT